MYKKFTLNFFTAFTLSSIVLTSFFQPSQAANYTWGGPGSTTVFSNLSLNTNWGPPITPGPADNGLFLGSGVLSPTLNTTQSVTSYVVTSPVPYQFNIGTNGYLQFSNGFVATNLGSNQFFLTNNGRIDFNSTSSAASVVPATYTLNDTTQIVFTQASTAAAANFVFNGPNTVIQLQQAVNNSVSGAISGTTGSGISTSGLVIAPANSSVITTFNGTGLKTFSGQTSLNNGTLLAGGTNVLSSNSLLAMSSIGILNLNGFANTVAALSGTNLNQIILGGSGGILTTNGNNTSTTYAGSITGAGGITKNGIGILTLSGSGLNTYLGQTIVNLGTLRSGTPNSFSPVSSVIMTSNSILDLSNNNNTIGSLSGTPTNLVALGNGVLTTGINGASTTYAGFINGSGGLTKVGGGIFTLSGPSFSIYTGPTTISAGTLRSGAPNSFAPNSSVTMTGTSIMDLNNNNNTIGALSGSATNVITLGSGTLTTNNPIGVPTTYAGAITGTGGLTKTGIIFLTLSGANLNTYSGATTIVGGAIIAGAINSLSPNSSVVLSGSNTLLALNNFDNTIGSLSGTLPTQFVILGTGTLTTGGDDTSTTFAGMINGAGGLIKTGSGNFTLSGSGLNNYTGTTTINAGTLSAGAANSFAPNSPVVMTGVSTLDLNDFNNSIASLTGVGSSLIDLGSAILTTNTNNTSTTYAGSILGTGGITKAGAGDLTFTGIGQVNYFGQTTIDSGTLRAGNVNTLSPNSNVNIAAIGTLDIQGFNNTIGALSGVSGSVVNVSSPGVFTFGNSNSTTFAGAFTGSGNVITQGNGSFNYTGNSSTFTGTTSIGNTLFALNGILGGNANLLNGSTLSGNGSIGGNLIVNSGSKISPGNSIGVIAVGGNYTQNANSTYVVEINDQFQSDLINVSGTAAINGGTVEVIALGGYNVFHDYLILNASGGVNGTYQNVTLSSFPDLVNPILTYTPNQIFLQIQTSIVNAACTNNGAVIALAIDNIQNPSPEFVNFLNTLVNLDNASVCNVLKEISGEQYTLAYIAAENNSRQFLRRLYDPLRSLVTAFPTCEMCDCYDPCAGTDFTPWLEVGGGQTYIHGNHNVSGLKQNNVEVSFGLQGTKNNFTLGIAGSYDHGSISYRLNGTGKSDTGYGALYGLYRPSFDPSSTRWYVLGDLAYGYSNTIVKRHVDIGSSRSFMKGNYHFNQFFGYIESGFDLYAKGFLVQPFLGFEGGTMKRSTIKEKGSSPLNLNVNGKVFNHAYSRLGFHATTDTSRFTDFNCSLPKISLSLDLAWTYRLTENSGYKLTENFQSFDGDFHINGIRNYRNSLDGALTISIDIHDKWQLYLEAVGSYWNQSGIYNILGGVSYSW